MLSPAMKFTRSMKIQPAYTIQLKTFCMSLKELVLEYTGRFLSLQAKQSAQCLQLTKT
jgi:hypothetical protein